MNNLAYDSDAEAASAVERDVADMHEMRPIPRISIQAFCETDGIANPIERAGEDRRMSKAHLKIHMGGIATAIEFYQTAPTPNLIILESRSEPKALLEGLGQLSEFCDPTTKVVVIGHVNDVYLYRELIRRGVDAYLHACEEAGDDARTVAAYLRVPEDPAELAAFEALALQAWPDP